MLTTQDAGVLSAALFRSFHRLDLQDTLHHLEQVHDGRARFGSWSAGCLVPALMRLPSAVSFRGQAKVPRYYPASGTKANVRTILHFSATTFSLHHYHPLRPP